MLVSLVSQMPLMSCVLHVSWMPLGSWVPFVQDAPVSQVLILSGAVLYIGAFLPAGVTGASGISDAALFLCATGGTGATLALGAAGVSVAT